MKEITFKTETEEQICKKLEQILMDNEYGRVKEAHMTESKQEMSFYDKRGDLLVKLCYRGDYDWLTYLVYVQRICDYYDRNVGELKFTVYFENDIS